MITEVVVGCAVVVDVVVVGATVVVDCIWIFICQNLLLLDMGRAVRYDKASFHVKNVGKVWFILIYKACWNDLFQINSKNTVVVVASVVVVVVVEVDVVVDVVVVAELVFINQSNVK